MPPLPAFLNRPPLRFWRCYCVFLFPAAWLAAACLSPDPLGLAFALVSAAAWLPLLWRLRWLGRLTWRTWRYRTRATARVVLHYPATWEGRWDLGILLRRVEGELDELAGQFGSGLRRRVAVFLFGSSADIARIFGREAGGFALPQDHAIFLAEDTDLEELLRHELAHLFAARWNVLAPPILGEGLAVWWQRTDGGRPVDALAEALLRHRRLNVPSLLKANGFVSGPRRNDCYLLAGGFTGFLIRRFGWESYRKFYRTAGGFNFRRKFRRVFGVSLEGAERRWRCEKFAQELLARRLGRV